MPPATLPLCLSLLVSSVSCTKAHREKFCPSSPRNELLVCPVLSGVVPSWDNQQACTSQVGTLESSHTPVAVACICSLRPARSSHALFNPPILVEIQVAFNNGTRSNKKRPRISQAPFRFCSQHSSFGFLISVQRWNERSGGEPSSQIDGPFPEERTSPFGGHRHDTTRHESKRSGNTDEVSFVRSKSNRQVSS